MASKKIIIIISVIVALVVATGIGVLVWWLVRDTTIDTPPTVTPDPELPENIFGDVRHTANFTRIEDVGDMFWWYFPSASTGVASVKPLLLWLDGVTGLPPSLLANFGMIGPFDIDMNRREDSWIEEYNLLFVDAPIGTGFSRPLNGGAIPKTIEENADILVLTLQSFYENHIESIDAPLYIVGQGSGAQLALALAARLPDVSFLHNLQGVVLGNGIVSPSLALTQLGFYLYELGYIDGNGRTAIESFSEETNALVQQQRYGEAFDKFLTLEDVVNQAAVALNLDFVIEKMMNDIVTGKDAEQLGQLSNLKCLSSDGYSFMETTVANALGIEGGYDTGRTEAVAAFRDSFMVPYVLLVEHILNSTNITVIIYNGNLDATSNTPGQLEWINNLQWSGQVEFRSSTRETLVVNRLVEGYFRVTDRLKFYWMNAAGLSVPVDSPTAIRRVFQLITEQ